MFPSENLLALEDCPKWVPIIQMNYKKQSGQQRHRLHM